MHPTYIEIDTKQFIVNLLAIRKYIGNKVKFILPVKANAYGHGLVPIAKVAEPLVDSFAVSCLNEGINLRKAGITKPILVFGAFYEEQIQELINYNLAITVPSQFKANILARFCKNSQIRCQVHLKIDTGMNRVGVRPNSSYPLIEFIIDNPYLNLVGIYTHLASADIPNHDFTKEQIDAFLLIREHIKQVKPEVLCHMANSGAVCYYPDSYCDAVRPGILSYGYIPGLIAPSSLPSSLSPQLTLSSSLLSASLPIVSDEAISSFTDLLQTIRPCFSLKTRVIYFKTTLANQFISYSHSYQTPRLTRVITLPIGYGDGYRRALSNVGNILLKGKKYKISGYICMDMTMVDIGPDTEAYPGDEVVLIGIQENNSILASEIASQLDTIIYEVLVGFNERIPRIFK